MFIGIALAVIGMYACQILIQSCTQYAFATMHMRPLNVEPPPSINEIAPMIKTNKNIICSICLELTNKKSTRQTTCGHTYCAPCIEKWIKIKATCPNCNKTFSSSPTFA
jgi:hypothetical protein